MKDGILLCPVCRAPLMRQGDALRCAGGRHSFDFSRAGHVNLAGGGYTPASGDPPEMVRARTAFLDTDSYLPLAEALAARASGVALDCGCGDGYYSVKIAGRCEALFGFDLSKSAVQHAARRARAANADNTLFAVSSVYSLPIGDGVCDTAFSVFAPCAEAEFLRLLRPGGRLVLAAAGRDHLTELKAVLYDTVQENTVRSDLPKNLRPVERETLSYRRILKPDALRALYLMTPYCRKTAREAAERLFSLPELAVTFSFDISVYER